VARDVAKSKPNAEFMARLTTFASLAILALLGCGSAAALNPDLSIKQLLHTAWGPRDGAPLGRINALAQTNDGYLWMVGPAGLYRFDGLAFERMEMPYSPKLSSLRPFTVFAARDGGVWIGFMFGGVARLKDGRWQVYSPDEGVPAGSPLGFSEAPDGTLWVAATGGIGRFDGLRWSMIGPETGLPPPPYRFPSVSVDGQGTIWVGASDEILSRHAGEPQFHRLRYVPTPHGVWYQAGTIWLVQENPNELVPLGQSPPPATVGSLADVRGPPVVDRDGGLWFVLDGYVRRLTHPERAVVGVPLTPHDIPDAYSKADGLTGLPFTALPDREGNVWIATSAGLDRFSEPRLEALPQSSRDQKCPPSGASSVGIAPTGEVDSLWVTNADNLVCLYKNSHWTPLLKQEVSCIFHADDGAVWFGGPKGLWRQQAGRLESMPLPMVGFPVQAMAMDKSGGLWVSIMRTGVFRLKDGSWKPSGGVPTLPPGPAITIVRDPHDRLWFSYPGGTVAVLDGDQVHTFGKSDGLRIGNVLANQAGRKEQWLGGELGLARFDGQHFYTVPTAPELPLGGITGIAESAQGDLWLNTPTGIVHLEASELDKNRLNSSYRVKGETIGAFDGLLESASAIRPLPTVAQTSDGKLWFSTTGGIYALDPAHQIHNRVPPPVIIRTLTAGDQTLDPTPGLRLPVRTTAVRFDFVALSLTAAQKVRYRYRLEGVDSDWRPISVARQALYTNLHPGNYTFRVIAANNDGVWNENGASLGFTIPPAFTQTGWFLSLCVGTGALAVWVLAWLRGHQVTARVRDRLEERMAERERIARDLHDTLLQSFHGLLLKFQTAYKLLPARSAEAKETLGVAIDDAFHAITEGRDAVQGLRALTVGGDDLAAAIKTLGEALAGQDSEHGSMLPRVDVTGTPQTLRPLVRDEIYRIAGESLRNAFRHADAKRIEVDLCYDERELRLRVRDDGKGIDPRFLREEGQAGHYGIPGMRERAKLLGGILTLWTAPDSGTEVELTIPGPLAYSVSPAVRRGWLLRKLFGARTPIES